MHLRAAIALMNHASISSIYIYCLPLRAYPRGFGDAIADLLLRNPPCNDISTDECTDEDTKFFYNGGVANLGDKWDDVAGSAQWKKCGAAYDILWPCEVYISLRSYMLLYRYMHGCLPCRRTCGTCWATWPDQST